MLTKRGASQLLLIVSLAACLAACVPRANTDAKSLFFSADVWGGSPFSEGQKKKVFLDALSAKSVRRLTKSVPFQNQDEAVNVLRFEAIYEVSAKQVPPVIKNGYRVVLELGDRPPERLRLLNTVTNVAWSLRLGSAN